MTLIKSSIVAASLVAFMAGCGGGGGDDTSTPPPAGDTPMTGVFIDSPVEGMRYTCLDTFYQGLTNAKGEFTCNSTATVEFYIDDLSIGQTKMTNIVTPYNLWPIEGAVNLARLLQTLDSDSNTSNGISLFYIQNGSVQLDYYYATVANASTDGEHINFMDPAFDALFNGTALEGNLIDPQAALEHMDASIQTYLQDNPTGGTGGTSGGTDPISGGSTDCAEGFVYDTTAGECVAFSSGGSDNPRIIPAEVGDDYAVCGMTGQGTVNTNLTDEEIVNIFTGDYPVGSPLLPDTMVNHHVVFNDLDNCQGKSVDIVNVVLGHGDRDVANSDTYSVHDDSYDYFVIGYVANIEIEHSTLGNADIVVYIDTDFNSDTGALVRGMGADIKRIYPKNASNPEMFAEYPKGIQEFVWNNTTYQWEENVAFLLNSNGGGAGSTDQGTGDDRYHASSLGNMPHINGRYVFGFFNYTADYKEIGEIIDITDPYDITAF